MRVVIIGAGTAVPVPRYSPAGIYVRAGREHLLFDAGAGSLQRLARLGVTFLTLDRLFLTHFHPDHCLDLASILFAMRLPAPRTPSEQRAARQAGLPIGRTRPFTVYGPRGLRRLYQGLNRALNGWLAPPVCRAGPVCRAEFGTGMHGTGRRSYRLRFEELPRRATVRGPGWTVRAEPMDHSTVALGYRIQAQGKSL